MMERAAAAAARGAHLLCLNGLTDEAAAMRLCGFGRYAVVMFGEWREEGVRGSVVVMVAADGDDDWANDDDGCAALPPPVSASEASRCMMRVEEEGDDLKRLLVPSDI